MQEVVKKQVKSSYADSIAAIPKISSNTIIAAISPYEYEEFIAPNNINWSQWSFRLHTLSDGNIIDAINKFKSEVLLTAWSTKILPKNIKSYTPTLKYISHICGTVCGFVPRGVIKDGIAVTNWGDCVSRTVGEHCLLQVLACLRRAAKWQLDVHVRKKWRPDKYEAFTLFDKTIGLHGFGGSAREFVKLVKPFNCKISAYSPNVPDSYFEQYNVKRSLSLEDIFSENEIIVDLASHTAQTHKIVNEGLLRKIRPGGIFVNSGRGAVVDEAAMAKVAREGRIQIALDVFEKEPLPEDSPLRGLENVFITPHIGGPTMDERKICGMHALKNIEAYFNKKPLKAVIGLAEYDRMTQKL
jgi:phosphoglycerate dehydrogenase-like enzyme